MRERKFVWNTVTSLVSQMISLICGFILPQMILNAYGTEVNGLVSSVNQFLTIVSLSEFGMTAVVQSALYKPLSNHDNYKISCIMASSVKFFRKIAIVLIIYVTALCVLYPILVKSNFDYVYIVTLIAILSINSLAQYLLGITNCQLLSADQRVYIVSLSTIVMTLLNTVGCYIVIQLGGGIHAVKLLTVSVFLIKPIVAQIYVKKNYRIDLQVKYTGEPITQKWNGVAQHISYYVFNSTDIVILSMFSTLENVSIYAVHALILNGLKQLCTLVDNSIKPLLGELWAKKENERLKTYFFFYEWFLNALSIFVFGCAVSLIESFVMIYTKGVNDANYNIPEFAIILTISYIVQNIRNTYNTMIQATGRYKETQYTFIWEAIINIVVSIIAVTKFGLVGVAIGTLVGALFQMLTQAMYIYKNILNANALKTIKLCLTDFLLILLGICITKILPMNANTYIEWVITAIPVALIWALLVIVMSLLLYRNEVEELKVRLKKSNR